MWPTLCRCDAHRMKLELKDEAGRRNRDPEEFRFEAKPNQLASIVAHVPFGQDVKVSPLEETSGNRNDGVR